MSLFIYEAADTDGKMLGGEVNAPDRASVVAILLQKQLTPIKISLKNSLQSSHLAAGTLWENFTARDKIILIRNLAATLKAGLSLNEALEILIADANKNITHNFLLDAQLNVQNGQTLSLVFEKNKRYFSPLFVGMIKAGEASGRLDSALEELSQHITKEYQLIKKVKSAMAYPSVLLVTAIGIIILMLTFVLPRLAKAFSENHLVLPLLTRILLKLSQMLTYSFPLDIGVLLAIIGAVLYIRKSKAGKKFTSYLVFRIPVINNLVKKVVLVRFARNLGNLIESALSISESLNLTAKAVDNDEFSVAILQADKELRNGIPLSQALKNYPDLFPNFLVSLVAVGEKTGTLGKVLKNFADFYEDDVDTSLKDLTTFLEPLLLLFMGLTVGLIALAILMPIYQMVGNFSY